MADATPSEGNNMIEIFIQRMNTERLSLKISLSEGLVEDLKEKIEEITAISSGRQRLIFRGRVLKDRELLSSYDLIDQSVIHLVERNIDHTYSQTQSGGSGPNPINGNTAQPNEQNASPFANLFGAVGQLPNVLFQRVNLDASTTPESMARQVTDSLMGAFTSFMGENGTLPTHIQGGIIDLNIPLGNTGSVSTQTGTGAAGTTSTNSSAPRQQSQSHPTPAEGAVRPIARPFGPLAAAVATSATNNNGNRYSSRSSTLRGSEASHQLVRSEYSRAMSNLNTDLSRLCLSPSGEALFALDPSSPNGSTTPAATGNTAEVEYLIKNFRAFEQVFTSMATACSQMNSALLTSNTLPWDRLHNYAGILQDLPLLLIVQRRLLASIRANARGGVDVPPHIDVPSFLDRRDLEVPSPPPPNASASMMEIEPPE